MALGTCIHSTISEHHFAVYMEKHEEVVRLVLSKNWMEKLVQELTQTELVDLEHWCQIYMGDQQ